MGRTGPAWSFSRPDALGESAPLAPRPGETHRAEGARQSRGGSSTPGLGRTRSVSRGHGASFDAVVKLTAFLTDTGRLREYTLVRNELITGPPPASTVVEVSALALPGMMIEVEAIAVL
jgi:hypothetical protein